MFILILQIGFQAARPEVQKSVKIFIWRQELRKTLEKPEILAFVSRHDCCHACVIIRATWRESWGIA